MGKLFCVPVKTTLGNSPGHAISGPRELRKVRGFVGTFRVDTTIRPEIYENDEVRIGSPDVWFRELGT